MSSGLFKVIVRFQNMHGIPLGGDGWMVRVYDDDPLVDGFLGESPVDDNGEAGILIAVADIHSFDSPEERTPDLYFKLYHNGKHIYKSPVFENVNFERKDSVTGNTSELTRVLGPIRVDH